MAELWPTSLISPLFLFFTDIDKLGMVVVDNERVQVDSEFSEV